MWSLKLQMEGICLQKKQANSFYENEMSKIFQLDTKTVGNTNE